MRAEFDTEFERLLDRARELLGEADDALLQEAHTAVNQALTLCPNSVDGWLVKCQVASATGDDIAALAAVEMAQHRAPERAECLYWRGAVLGDLGRHREALRAIETALRVITDDDHWLLEDLFYEKGAVLDAIGRQDEALATYEAGLKRCPDSQILKAGMEPIRRARQRRIFKVLRGGLS